MVSTNSKNTIDASKNNGMPSPIVATTTIAPLPHALPHAKPFPDISKIEVFEGQNFNQW